MTEKNGVSLADLSRRFRTDRLALGRYMRHLRGIFEEREPLVKAFVTKISDCFKSLSQELDRIESRFTEPSSRPPLYAIPVGVKDVFHVEGFPTRAGSQLPPEVLKGPEAKAVTILKSSGAIILGKTVTTEFAYRAPSPTCNPHNLKHTPGGSSSGSAAAVASGLCPLALGTQSGGSILRPAAYCGVVGFKPSYGRISTGGVIPLAPSLDHVGFFTQDVEGAILVASVLCEGWTEAPEMPPLVFGVPQGPYLKKASEEGLTHFHRTCEQLSDAGLEIRSIEMFPNFEELMERIEKLVAAEAALVHREWFHNYSDMYHKINVALIRKGQTVRQDVLAACRNGRQKLRNEILTIMYRNNLSVLLAPAAVGPAPKNLETTGDPVMNSPWTYAGLPALTLPSGKSRKGMPIGLQMIGSWMADETLLEVAKYVDELLD